MIKKCLICGEDFKTHLSEVKKGHGKFCSLKCWGVWKSGNWVGYKSPSWKGGDVKKKCILCGKNVLIKRSQDRLGFGKFCSRKCFGIWRTKNFSGKNHPLWNKIEKHCEVCGDSRYVVPAIIKLNQRFFCSRKCLGIWNSINRSGENCSRWKGGVTHPHHLIRTSNKYYKWRVQVFTRDHFTCQKCGDGRGGNLNAHHIKGFAEHPNLQLKINNGITLCKSCHKKEHQK